jgi:hypothetical protein
MAEGMDSVLRISTAVDVAPIKEGMEQIKTTVGTATAKMEEQFSAAAGVQDASGKSLEGLAVKVTELEDVQDDASKTQSDVTDTTNQSTDAIADNSTQQVQGATAAAGYMKSISGVGEAMSSAFSKEEVNAAIAARQALIKTIIGAISTAEGEVIRLGDAFKSMQGAGAPFESLKKVSDNLADAQVAVKLGQNELKAAQNDGISSLELMSARTGLMNASLRESQAEMRESKIGVQLLTREFGLHLPKAIVAFISKLGPLAGIMAAAFTPVMILGLVQALAKQLPEAFDKAKESLSRWINHVTYAKEKQKELTDVMQRTVAEIRNMQDALEKLSVSKSIELHIDTERAMEDLGKVQARIKTLREQGEIKNPENRALAEDLINYDKLIEKSREFGISTADIEETMGVVREEIKDIGNSSGRTKAYDTLKKEMDDSKAFYEKMRTMRETSASEGAAAGARTASNEIELARKKYHESARLLFQYQAQELAGKYKVEESKRKEGLETDSLERAENKARYEQSDTINKAELDSRKTMLQQRFEAGRISLQLELAESVKLAQDESGLEITKLKHKKLALEEEQKNKKDNKAAILAVDAEILAAEIKGSANIVKLNQETVDKLRIQEESRIAVAKKVADARLDYERAVSSALLSISAITVDQQMAQERALEEKRHANALKQLEDRKANIEKEVGGPKAPPRPPEIGSKLYDEYVGIQTDIETENINHNTKILSENTSADERNLNLMREAGKNAIDIRKELTLLDISATETANDQLYALNRISSDELTDRQLANNTKKINAQRQFITSELLLKKQMGNVTFVEEQLAADKLLALDKEEAAERERILISGDGRLRAARVDEIEIEFSLQMEAAERERSEASKNAEEMLWNNRNRINQWLADEKAANNNLYALSAAAENRRFAALSAEDAASEAEKRRHYQTLEMLLRKHNQTETDLEREAAQRRKQQVERYAAQVHSILTVNLNQAIQGQKTFAQAMVDSWNSLVMSVIEAIEHMVEVWIVNQILMAVFGKSKSGDHAAANAASATSDAFAAAAAAFASAMEALPFPANTITAPIVAMTALAQGLVYAGGAGAAGGASAGFAKGGIVEKDMVAKVHEREMILPKDISIGLQEIIKGGSNRESNIITTTANNSRESASTIFQQATSEKNIIDNKSILQISKSSIILDSSTFKQFTEAISSIVSSERINTTGPASEKTTERINSSTDFAAKSGKEVGAANSAATKATELISYFEKAVENASTQEDKTITGTTNIAEESSAALFRQGIIDNKTATQISKSSMILDTKTARNIQELISRKSEIERTITEPTAGALGGITIPTMISLPKAAKGGIVGSDSYLQVHKSELVLNRELSETFQRIVSRAEPAPSVGKSDNGSEIVVQLSKSDIVLNPEISVGIRNMMRNVATFAQGGIVEKDSIAQVHAKEMVLPPAISTGLQQVIKSGSILRENSVTTNNSSDRSSTSETIKESAKESTARESAASSLSVISKETKNAVETAKTAVSTMSTKESSILSSHALAAKAELKSLYHQGIVENDIISRIDRTSLVLDSKTAKQFMEVISRTKEVDRTAMASVEVMPYALPGSATAAPAAAAPATLGFAKAIGYALSGVVGSDKKVQVHSSELILHKDLSESLQRILLRSEPAEKVGVAKQGTEAIVQLHKSEVVLNPEISVSIRDMFRNMATFAQGGIAGADMFASIHENEMVLPANISSGFQEMLKSTVPMSAGKQIPSVIHLNYAPTVYGEKEWMKRVLHDHADDIGRQVKRQMRKGTLPSYS